jgi:hypothetical protein
MVKSFVLRGRRWGVKHGPTTLNRRKTVFGMASSSLFSQEGVSGLPFRRKSHGSVFLGDTKRVILVDSVPHCLRSAYSDFENHADAF